MMKKILKFLVLNIIIITVCTTFCYAESIKVTEEKLNEVVQKFVNSQENDENYKIQLSNSIMKITSKEGSYNVNYDLSSKPTFSVTIPIQKGMSYEIFKKETENLNLPIIGYLAVANIEGIEFEDAMSYFFLTYLSEDLNGSWLSENSYIIVDDINMSEGVTIIKDESNSKKIYTSEFGERVMEYVNNIYKTKYVITDEKDLNSYTYTIERKDVTEDSCKLISTLTVNPETDFSKLEGYMDNFMDTNITEENADYVIKLKVGQNCNIESNKEIKGYSISGGECIEFNETRTVIKAIKPGKVNGYLYIGDEQVKKSIYIIVEENPTNEKLEPITINIETPINNATTTTNIKNDKKKLPQTGIYSVMRNILEILIISLLIILVGMIIKNTKHKK